MARLKQQHPQNYISSSKIHTDIENIVRYLNAAELGNKTISELLSTLFDEDGEFAGPIEFRLNTATGLEYRIGTYSGAEDGWILITEMANIRGVDGRDFGTIEGPIFFNRTDFVATAAQTNFPYVYDIINENIAVYKNGVLLREQGVSPPYTYNSGTDEVVLSSGAALNDIISVYTIRVSSVSNYRRADYVAVGSVAVVPFAHTDQERLLVYKNGLLQREGGSADYVRSAAQGTITYLSALVNNDVSTILTVENLSQATVAGLMTEDEYTDVNGLILYAKLSIANNDIAQAKVANLTTDLAAKAKMTVASSAPGTPTSGNLWMDTSVTPNVLRFYDGTQWLSASPEQVLPTFTISNVNQYVRINGTGTGYEYGDIDFSALVPKTYMAASNGVASLDASGKIPTGQLPEIFSVGTLSLIDAGATPNADYHVSQVYKQKIEIDGITAVLSSGTCTIQIKVDGVAVGSTYAVSSSRISQAIAPTIEVDATTVGKEIEIVVTAQSGANDLRVGLSFATLST